MKTGNCWLCGYRCLSLFAAKYKGHRVHTYCLEQQLVGVKQQTSFKEEGRKTYNIRSGVGRAKYVVSYHNNKFHADGSEFFDIKIFKNQPLLQAFIQILDSQGYQAE